VQRAREPESQRERAANGVPTRRARDREALLETGRPIGEPFADRAAAVFDAVGPRPRCGGVGDGRQRAAEADASQSKGLSRLGGGEGREVGLLEGDEAAGELE
jgi:hypothetical protein